MLTVARAGASVAGRRWLSAAATAAAAAEHRITTLPNGFRVVTEQVCAVTAGCLLVVLPLCRALFFLFCFGERGGGGRAWGGCVSTRSPLMFTHTCCLPCVFGLLQLRRHRTPQQPLACTLMPAAALRLPRTTGLFCHTCLRVHV